MYRDSLFGFIEQYAMITDAEPEEPLKLVIERFPARASLGVTMDCFENVQCAPLPPRTWSIVKPRSATTCSKEMPSPPRSK